MAHLVEDLKVGGLEKMIAAIALGVDKRKYAAEVWCLAQGGPVAQWLENMGLRVRIFSWHTYHNPLNILRLALQLRKSRIDIVHTHGYYAGTFGRLAAFIAGITRVFAHVHTSQYAFDMRQRKIDKCLSYVTRRIICVSRSVKDFVELEEGVRPSKTCLVYNAVSPIMGGRSPCRMRFRGCARQVRMIS